MTDWVVEGYPGGAKVPGKSAKLNLKRAPEKGLIHSTEGDTFPNYPAGYEPHATVAPLLGRWQQHTPLNQASFGLRAATNVPTNTLGVIQVEIVGHAATLKDLSGAPLAYLIGFLKFFFAAAGIPEQTSVQFVGGEAYGLHGAVRLSFAAWDGYKGWLGHQHAPAPNVHWDPGAIPLKDWLGVIDVDHPLPPPPPPKPPKPNCVALQNAVRTLPDNEWGPNTDQHCDAVREASNWGGNDFPWGVKYTQAVVGTKTDGSWGPNSRAAHDATVRAIQDALRSMGFDPGASDGKWGPKTEAAYQAARTACHI